MTMAWLRPVARICIAAVVFVGAVLAQTLGTSASVGRLMAQTPPDQADPKLPALQVAIDSKDTTAIFNLLNQTPGDERSPLAALLLSAAQDLTSNSPTGGFGFSNVTTLGSRQSDRYGKSDPASLTDSEKD